jgi:hypothetical protein
MLHLPLSGVNRVCRSKSSRSDLELKRCQRMMPEHVKARISYNSASLVDVNSNKIAKRFYGTRRCRSAMKLPAATRRARRRVSRPKGSLTSLTAGSFTVDLNQILCRVVQIATQRWSGRIGRIDMLRAYRPCLGGHRLPGDYLKYTRRSKNLKSKDEVNRGDRI